MKSVNEIRNSFLNFFKLNDHTVVSSSSLVPHNDPTLMFTTAGMVQFKDAFTGNEILKYSKAASSQKCVRAGGKHNDLDNVGYTARHHTFFEMLGNFSFGNYFKEDAIEFAWKFLTKELGLSLDKLYITIYYNDEEAYDIWRKITSFSDHKIIRINTNDNFWSMGDTGPCGPCSEIFYDHGEHIWGGLPGTKEQDGDRFVEIWNLVFMQYEQLEGQRINLPKPCIDTGMGLERIAAVVQNVHDNYDIDLFQNLIADSKHLTKTSSNDHETLISHRVIADHLRSSSFLIADGVMPSNEGRGYVLRRIMRRAMRHAHQLGCDEPLLYQLVPSLIREMSEAYPELSKAQKLITETLKQEEERFKLTLSRGLKLLETEAAGLTKGSNLSGETAFKLYDTYGFPIDLTKDILRKKQITVNEDEFNVCMLKQRELAKASWIGSGAQKVAEIWFDIRNQHGGTEFVGYDLTHIETKIQALIIDNKEVEQITDLNQQFDIISNQTPFYGESGGQLGDIGTMTNKDAKLSVINTSKYLGNLIVHHAKLEHGVIKVGDTLTAHVDVDYRNKLRANHSATHLLHGCIRKILGEHVSQKGSLVSSDKLRFDISHNKPLTKEQLIQIEQHVNTLIRQNSEVCTVIMDTETALKSNAIGLFGEKYDSEVRVVSMGNHEKDIFSTELCGGTHVIRTGDIGLFKITDEYAIAAGIRRIEALTGEAALNYVQQHETYLHELSATLTSPVNELIGRIKSLVLDKKKGEKEISLLRQKLAMQASNINKEQIGDIEVISQIVNEVPVKELRNLALPHLNKSNKIIIIVGIINNKAVIILAISEELTARLDATKLIKSAVELLGGTGGGGKPNFAQGGGPNITNVESAITAIKSQII